MARKDTADELARMIDELQQERQEHLNAIARIDDTFERFGIQPASNAPSPAATKRKAPTRKRAPSKKTTRRRRRQTFDKTGEESVLDFVRQSNDPPNAREVNEHWNGEGRGGKADNTLSRLVKAGQLERVDVPGERGGRYRLADSASE